MPEPYSLLRGPWLPVALDNGHRVFVRPCDISEPFEGRRIVHVATGRPDCDISLTELLIGLLAVSIDGTDEDGWVDRFRAPPSRTELETALAPLDGAMLLDGDGPRFFQDLEELDGETNRIEALLIDAPGANTIRDNADHFVKHGRTVALSRAGAAAVLATLQTSAPSGGAGHRTSLRGGGPLTTLVVPGLPGNSEPTLWQRLWANVPNGFRAKPQELKEVFPWLVPTRISDRTGVSTTPSDVHPAQAFFGLPRRIRLNFEPNSDGRPCDLLGHVDDVIVTRYTTRPWDINYTAWSRGHPLSPYYKQRAADAEFLPLHLKSSRVGYRDFLGIAVATADGLRLPARCIDAFFKHAESFEGAEKRALLDSRILAAGYAMDNMKPLDFAEAFVPLLLTGNAEGDAHLKDAARRFVTAAILVANQLVKAVKQGLYGSRNQTKWDVTVLDAVRQRFWVDTEQPFYSTLRRMTQPLVDPESRLSEQPAEAKQTIGQARLHVLRTRSLAIFDDTVPIENAESGKIKDVIEGRKLLGVALEGYGAVGIKLFVELNQPEHQIKAKKAKTAA